ncbi:MAG: tripartite tricarboxylate transporter substrate-binding protein, partial [Burkholderiales bacterium]
VAESGFPGFEAYSWIGIFAPAATPIVTLSQLTEGFQSTLQDPEVKQRLTAAGFEVMATNGPAVDRYTREQYDRWRSFVQEANLKLEE